MHVCISGPFIRMDKWKNATVSDERNVKIRVHVRQKCREQHANGWANLYSLKRFHKCLKFELVAIFSAETILTSYSASTSSNRARQYIRLLLLLSFVPFDKASSSVIRTKKRRQNEHAKRAKTIK